MVIITEKLIESNFKFNNDNIFNGESGTIGIFTKTKNQSCILMELMRKEYSSQEILVFDITVPRLALRGGSDFRWINPNGSNAEIYLKGGIFHCGITYSDDEFDRISHMLRFANKNSIEVF